MSDKYAALKQAAENATPGEWVMSNEYYLRIRDSEQNIIASAGYANERQEMLDATFIAAANPSTILELLAERDADKRRIAELTAERDALREGEMGDAKHSNTRAAADIYFQLVEECEIPPGGSLVEHVDDMRQRITDLEARTLTVKPAEEYADDAELLFCTDACDDLEDYRTAQWLKELRRRRSAGISLKIEGE